METDTRTFRCRDAGLQCDFEAKGKNDEEILNQVREHITQKHREGFTDELKEKVRNLINRGEIKAA